MTFQSHKGRIHWKIHFSSPVEKVFEVLTTDNGRESFWAEKTLENDGRIEFTFLNYPVHIAKILNKKAPDLFSLEYFGAEVIFELSATDDGGTDLHLTVKVNDEDVRLEMIPGWVSVLMAMKAAIDFGVDLRNHDQNRTWDNGYVDN